MTQSVAALSDDEVTAKKDFVKQEPLPNLGSLSAFAAGLASLRSQAQELLNRKVSPPQALEDLLADPALQSWVKEGVRYHKGKRADCAFCRQPLPVALFETLAKHFSKESEDLEDALRSCLARVEAEAERAKVPALAASSVYASERHAFAEASTALSAAFATYARDLGALATAVRTRLASLFDAIEMPSQEFDPAKADKAIAAINAVFEANNAKTSTLVKDKEEARAALRRDNVLAFMVANDLSGKKSRIAELAVKANEFGAAEKDAKEAEESLANQARSLEA